MIHVVKNRVERLNWSVVASFEKWNDYDGPLQAADLRRLMRPDDEGVWDKGNLLCTPGITRLLNLLIGAGGQAFNNANCRLGTGNGSTAATAADTDLSAAAGAANRWFNMADAANPSVSSNVLTVVSTFASANGNYNWLEWGIDNGSAGSAVVTAPLLNHKIPASSLGVKATGATWALTVTITIS